MVAKRPNIGIIPQILPGSRHVHLHLSFRCYVLRPAEHAIIPPFSLHPKKRGFPRASRRLTPFSHTDRPLASPQGIGRAAALVFARKGYNVVVAARDESKLGYVVEDCAQAAGRAGAALAVPTDVTQERQVQALVNTVLAKFESVDVVVNCAGVFARGAFQDTPMLEAKRLMEVNYLGPYMVTQAFLPVLLKGGARARGTFGGGGERPSVIMLTGFSGRVPTKYMSAFGASKAALESLAASLRTEVDAQGVHVGVVQPGLVKSNFMERAAFYGKNGEEDRRSFRQMLRSLPIAQSPGEVAEAIYDCVTSKSNEVSVGLPFSAAVQAYKFTGLNPSAVPFT
ncbi:hypothetical protein Vretifemale_8448 [Volvox reticuliferus]|uniref:Uncharacterized protein n=1 Tax=Volvox reticuliferus TaxID=1737510 RepID=A0A8J4CAT0_9CHLO|nr:hypothetical protein Vretifemale_8448 [Volvox reticuliferus]